MREAFMSSLYYLNRVIDSVRSAYNLNHLNNVYIGDLQEGIIISINDKPYFYVFSQHVLSDQIDDISDLGPVLENLQLIDKSPEIALVEKFFSSAKSWMHREDFVRAIIDLQTSFEIYIRNSYRLILIQTNVDDEVIKTRLKDNLKNIIEIHLSRKLDIDLAYLSGAKKWFDNLYLIRNEIVHEGRYEVSGDEMYLAYDAYVELRNLIADSLVEKGYLSKEGKINLKLFNKNIKETEGPERANLIKELKKKGLLPNKKIKSLN